MQAVIFDFDGTIVDTEKIWVDIYSKLISEKFNHVVPTEIFALCIGTTDILLYEYLRKNVDATIDREQLAPIAEKLIGEQLAFLEPRPGVVELLSTFANQGLRIAIASGSKKKWITPFLIKNNLLHFFEEIRCADDVENLKPHPELYLAALDALQLPATECFAIEDSVNGAKSALAANLQCFVVPSEVTANLQFPEAVILKKNFNEVSLDSLKIK
ncbi:MAG: HAD-IA family hydrolase [Kurthia sp.]|nr:HAD-IA family hydrolase [Candidatus Kurthia equi]